MSQPTSTDDATQRLSSDEAFELVGNDIRIAILRALWKAPEEGISFSELRRRAGGPDSGQFNYHLKKLLGTFVQKTDEGYKPRHTGKQVVTAILAGATDEDPRLEGVDVDGTCPFCGGALEASYEDEEATIRCRACGKIQMLEEFPPVAFSGRTSEEVVHALDRWVLGRSQLMTEGVCPNCAGTVETTIFETRSAGDGHEDYVRVRHTCRNCTYECDVPVWLYLLLVHHPAVISFYYEHGIDITALPGWERTALGTDYVVTIRNANPLRVEVVIPLEGDELHVTLDDELTVVDVGRQAVSVAG